MSCERRCCSSSAFVTSVTPHRRTRPARSVRQVVQVNKPAVAFLVHADARKTHVESEPEQPVRVAPVDSEVRRPPGRVRPVEPGRRDARIVLTAPIAARDDQRPAELLPQLVELRHEVGRDQVQPAMPAGELIALEVPPRFTHLQTPNRAVPNTRTAATDSAGDRTPPSWRPDPTRCGRSI